MAGLSTRPFHAYPVRRTSATTGAAWPSPPGLLTRHGLMEAGIEGLVDRAENGEALAGQHAQQLSLNGVDALDALAHRGLAGVEHGQQFAVASLEAA